MPIKNIGNQKRFWLAAGLGLAVSLTVFGNGLNGQFVYDDNLVLSHPQFTHPGGFLAFLGEPYFEDVPQAGLYRPLTQISLAFNFLFSGRPFGFHLTNIFLHLINTLLAVWLVRKLIGSEWVSWLAGLIFLVIPVHVEAVTSIVGRAELLAFGLGVGTVWLWLNKRYWLAGMGLMLALLSKETAVSIPIILALLAYIQRRGWGWLWPQLAAIGTYLVLRLAVLGGHAFGVKAEFIFNPLAVIPVWQRILTAAKVLLLYLQKIFVPYNLSADYSYNQIPVVTSLANPAAWLGIGVLTGMGWLAYRSVKSRQLNIPALTVMFFLPPYLVISNLIVPIGTIMGDRLMYFPSLGAAILLGGGLLWLVKRQRIVGGLALIAVLMVFSYLTVRQNRVWANEETLMRAAYEKSPRSVVAKANLGVIILNSDTALARQLAQEVYQQYPDHVKNLNLLAALAVKDRDFPAAQQWLERALALRPYHQGALENLSRVYFTQNKLNEAETALHTLATRYGGTGNVIFYAVVKVQNGKYQEATAILDSYFGATSDETGQTLKHYAEAKLGRQPLTKELDNRYKQLAASFRYGQK